MAQGKFDEAAPLYREALEGRQHLGNAHPDTLTSINDQAIFLIDQGKLDEAAPLYSEALEGTRQAFSDAHPSTTCAADRLSRLLSALGRRDEAVNITT